MRGKEPGLCGTEDGNEQSRRVRVGAKTTYDSEVAKAASGGLRRSLLAC
jgi:hypothetical protein